MLSGTVKAGLGLRAATVPFWTFGLLPRLRFEGYAVEIVRFRESSDSIFLRIACEGLSASFGTARDVMRLLGIPLGAEEGTLRGMDMLEVHKIENGKSKHVYVGRHDDTDALSHPAYGRLL